MLRLGLVTRDTGIPASYRLNIKDEVLALDFDLAVSLRLLRYDNEQVIEDRNFLSRLHMGEDAYKQEVTDVLGSEFLNDKYADSNTQVW